MFTWWAADINAGLIAENAVPCCENGADESLSKFESATEPDVNEIPLRAGTFM